MSKKGGRRGYLTRTLESHIQSIQETFQMLDKPAAASLDKVEWSEVTKLGDEVSKQATVAGMVWNGEVREVKELEENMGAYFNMLHGFILICHGSTVGAGPTLHKSICTSAKQVVDCSLSLLREAVSSYDTRNSSKILTIPQLSGSVWEVCAALKKTPTTNCTAVGRAITQVAVSVKDVLREMRELKPTNEAASCAAQADASPDEADNSSTDDGFSEGLSPEEMIAAQLVIDIATNSLDALKEVIRFLSGLLKSSNWEVDTKNFIEYLERLLSRCQEIGSQVSELGACVYPPQEIFEMKAIAKKIGDEVDGIRLEVESMENSKEKLFMAFQGLESSLGRLESGLAGDLVVSEMDKLGLC